MKNFLIIEEEQDWNYQDYLDTWDDHFGDDKEGEFTYYVNRSKRTKTLKKMTEQEFKNAANEVDRLGKEVSELQAREDYATNPGIDKRVLELLEQSFPYELALFC